MSGFSLFAFLGSLIGGAALDSYEARKGKQRLAEFKRKEALKEHFNNIHDNKESSFSCICYAIEEEMSPPYLTYWMTDFSASLIESKDILRLSDKPTTPYDILEYSPFTINLPKIMNKYPEVIDKWQELGILPPTTEMKRNFWDVWHREYGAEKCDAKLEMEFGSLILLNTTIWLAEVEVLAQHGFVEWDNFAYWEKRWTDGSWECDLKNGAWQIGRSPEDRMIYLHSDNHIPMIRNTFKETKPITQEIKQDIKDNVGIHTKKLAKLILSLEKMHLYAEINREKFKILEDKNKEELVEECALTDVKETDGGLRFGE